jgi:hypothetical protein
VRLFFHHVGQKGADEDFKKTVYKDVSIQTVESNVPVNYPHRSELLNQLGQEFPTDLFNCWGVPAGAKSVMGQLAAGDFVLLVHSATEYGEVPVLCNVQVFWPDELWDLSLSLWGSNKYPYVFFFRTERLALSWATFIEHLGYKHNFNPRGNFYSVASSRLDDFDGIEGYVQYLRGNYSMLQDPFAPVTEQDLRESGIDQIVNKGEVDRALAAGERKLAQSPQLTVGLDRQHKQITIRPRDAAFSIEVKKAYGFRCAVCGSSLQSPKGQSEAESAHIYPKGEDGSDDLRNGLCLCRRHHWALDVGWISLSDNYTVLVHPDLPENEDYDFIRQYAGERILPPSDARFAPHPVFLQAHRELMGFAEVPIPRST